ncbi:MAG TPA: hypothetical protein VMB50_22340 [Myxococcales bacterium]|nr:hypothetical protein [Myxococcales bacterium]
MRLSLAALGGALALAACHSGLPLNDAGFVCGLAGNPCSSAADCCAGLICSSSGCAFPFLSATTGSSGGGTSCLNTGGCRSDADCCVPGAYCAGSGSCEDYLLVGDSCTDPTIDPGSQLCVPGAACVSSVCIFGWQNGCGGTGGSPAGTTGAGASGGTTSGGATSGGTTGGGDGGCVCEQLCADAGSADCLCDSHGGCVQCLGDSDCAFAYCDTQPGDPGYGTCGPCVSSTQCDGGVCNPSSGSCQTDCRAPGFPGCSAGTSAGICDPDTGLCVGCLTSANCTGGLKCDPQIRQCVTCVTWADCPYDVPGCLDGTCGGCASAADCPPDDGCSPDGRCYCTDDQGCGGDVPTCVAPGPHPLGDDSSGCGCSDSSQCCGSDVVCAPVASGSQASFDGVDANGVCLPSCTVAGCRQGLCNPENGVCQSCLVDADCTTAPFCDGGTCVGCSIDADCASLDAGTPFCTSGSCVACLSYTQCPPSTPGCSSSAHSCGSCAGSSDCPPGSGCFTGQVCAPFCGLDGANQGCAACTSNADCEGRNCDASTGFCS